MLKEKSSSRRKKTVKSLKHVCGRNGQETSRSMVLLQKIASKPNKRWPSK